MRWELPDGWHWKPVAESLTRVRSQVHPELIRDEWMYVGLEHVQSGTGEYQGVEAGVAKVKSNKFQFQPGDVLYGKLRPNLRKCVVAREAGICSTDLVPLRPTDPDAAHFLALQLRSEPVTASIMRMIGGASLPRVSVKDLFTLHLPTPPADDAERLYAVARSIETLRQSQRSLEATVGDADRAATEAVLGYPPSQESSVDVSAVLDA